MHVNVGYKLSNKAPIRDSLKLSELPSGSPVTLNTEHYLEHHGITQFTITHCSNTYFTRDGICFILYGPGLAYQERLMGGYGRFYNPAGLALGKYVFFSGNFYMASHVFVVEGVADALAIWQEGYESIALLGTMLTPDRVNLILKLGKYKKVLFIPDNDNAGIGCVANISNYLPLWRGNIRYLPAMYKDFCDMPVEFRADWLKRAI